MIKSNDYNIYEYVDPYNSKLEHWMRVEHLGRYLYVKDAIETDSVVLDAGCANGYGSKILSDNASVLVAVDKNSDYIELAKKNNNRSNIKYKVMDLDKDKLDYLYDYIVCLETLEHVSNPTYVLDNFYSSLKNDGILFISVPNSKFEEVNDGKNINKYHLHTFEYDELVKTFKRSGFRVLRVMGQSTVNKQYNKKINDNEEYNVFDDAISIGYPDDVDVHNTFSYLFVLNKVVKK